MTEQRPSTRRGRQASATKTANSAVAKAEVDLASLDRAALLQLQSDVEKALRTYEKRRREKVLLEMEAVAQKHGLSFKDIVQSGATRAATPPKFRHRENPSLTWSGRGRQPFWYKEAIQEGAKPEELLIA